MVDLAALIGKVKEAGGKGNPEPVYQKLGVNVARARENRAMTQSDLASAIGKSVATVAEIELGTTRILLSDVEKIASVLGVQPKQLMTGVWW